MAAKRITDKQKRSFYSQLYVLLRAGMSFTVSFSVIVEGAKGHGKELFARIFKKIITGDSLWNTMKEESDFSQIDYGVVRVGEESGNLLAALAFLKDYYERKEKQRREIIGALSYPAIVLAFSAIVVIFMLAVVVPMFEQVYARMGGELPYLTRMIMFMASKLPVILCVLVTIAAVAYAIDRVYRNVADYMLFKARVTLALPVVGKLIRIIQLSRFCSIMNLLVSSDVPILQSLALARDVLSLYPFRESIKDIAQKVQNGSLINEAFALYPNLYEKRFLMMIRVGEETNSLPEIFGSLSEDITEELNYYVKQMNSILEPVLIILIGSIVAFVLIALYLPMFRLGMTIQ